MRGSRGYADPHGSCSNRNARPASVTRQPRQPAAQSSCRLCKIGVPASTHTIALFNRVTNWRHPPISWRLNLANCNFADAAFLKPSDLPARSSRRTGRNCAPLGGIACPVAILLQQPSYRTTSPCSSGGTIGEKRGQHNIGAPALKVNHPGPAALLVGVRRGPGATCVVALL